MCKYALITLNIIEYASIYLKKKTNSAEYGRILNGSDAAHSIRYKFGYTCNLEPNTCSELCQAFKME